MLLHETLALCTVATACGASRLMGPRSTAGIHTNHCTGLESRWEGEVGHAAAGISVELAEEIVQKAVAEYESRLRDGPIGKPFNELYNLVTLKPNEEWQKIYDQAKAQATEWGLNFK
jgi:methylamine--corrinoid protein Co-methyltransferase|tara:strand:+ start:387 stop:737 length:351 start_codon:yes stop_codon:yes gene_type:complete